MPIILQSSGPFYALVMKKDIALTLLLTVATLCACSGGSAASGTPTTPSPQKPSPAQPQPGTAAAWTMSGTVKTEGGEPLAGVEVFADHTAFYNMNAVGKTDAQGRYRIPLAHQPGTWAAGAYYRVKLGAQTFEVRLSPNNDTPFDGSKGAVRDFTFRASDAPAGTVNTYVAHSDVELNYDTLQLTFTPDGPNVLGSTKTFTRPFVTGSGIQNVPLGRYQVSASQTLNGAGQQLLLSSADQKTFAPRVLAEFHDAGDRYGPTLELFLKNP